MTPRLCDCCEERPATLDHLADGRHFAICVECYVPNGCPPRLIDTALFAAQALESTR